MQMYDAMYSTFKNACDTKFLDVRVILLNYPCLQFLSGIVFSLNNETVIGSLWALNLRYTWMDGTQQ